MSIVSNELILAKIRFHQISENSRSAAFRLTPSDYDRDIDLFRTLPRPWERK